MMRPPLLYRYNLRLEPAYLSKPTVLNHGKQREMCDTILKLSFCHSLLITVQE